MALSDADVQKQIKHMIAFIDQEANEKAEEIDAKAEEEFEIEKGRLVQMHRVKIMEQYERRQKQIELQRKIQISNLSNAARLKILKAREDHLRKVTEGTRQMLVKLTQDPSRYKILMEGLLTQCLFKLLEAEVVVRCKKQDAHIIEELIPKCVDYYMKSTGKKVKVTADKEQYLPSDSTGGVEALSGNLKIKVENTLDSRLQSISHTIAPELREILFGKNPNRKFRD
ncbi:hypothetical protein HELRODRAFT_185294 [Helobdella robusta]|uniref:V-type proton ATPase subunit E n=1 Tax=Helobdella robusta TaxID=6412 RepID=T1FMM4_HELRO|nr:hypothetical protein HELRODRAFT_185294 [Helobdella robusta]ESO10946.1 hypothetical protein HELRODRAFT_185294 [Helobdella robusta]